MFSFAKSDSFTVSSNIYRQDGQTFDLFQGVGGTVDTLDNVFDKQLELKFSSITKDIHKLSEDYSLGKFDNVEDLMTDMFNEQFSRKIYNAISQTKQTEYQEELRVLFAKMFEGLQQCVLQNLKIKDLESKLKICEERSSILDDKDKLIEYIQNLNNRFTMIEDQTITTISATLKPEYQKYIDLYGLPEGLVFDTDKLNQIKYDL